RGSDSLAERGHHAPGHKNVSRLRCVRHWEQGSAGLWNFTLSSASALLVLRFFLRRRQPGWLRAVLGVVAYPAYCLTATRREVVSRRPTAPDRATRVVERKKRRTSSTISRPSDLFRRGRMRPWTAAYEFQGRNFQASPAGTDQAVARLR